MDRGFCVHCKTTNTPHISEHLEHLIHEPVGISSQRSSTRPLSAYSLRLFSQHWTSKLLSCYKWTNWISCEQMTGVCEVCVWAKLEDCFVSDLLCLMLLSEIILSMGDKLLLNYRSSDLWRERLKQGVPQQIPFFFLEHTHTFCSLSHTQLDRLYGVQLKHTAHGSVWLSHACACMPKHIRIKFIFLWGRPLS